MLSYVIKLCLICVCNDINVHLLFHTKRGVKYYDFFGLNIHNKLFVVYVQVTCLMMNRDSFMSDLILGIVFFDTLFLCKIY